MVKHAAKPESKMARHIQNFLAYKIPSGNAIQEIILLWTNFRVPFSFSFHHSEKRYIRLF